MLKKALCCILLASLISTTAYAGVIITTPIDQMTTEELFQAGISAYDQGEYGKAAEYYALASDQGDAEAQEALGLMYYYGQGVEQDYEKAAEYYRQAAEMGVEMAEEALKRLGDEGKISAAE